MAAERNTKTQNNGNGIIKLKFLCTNKSLIIIYKITAVILANLNYGLVFLLSFHFAKGCLLGTQTQILKCRIYNSSMRPIGIK